MRMRKFITCFFRITMMLIFLQHQQVASLSRIHQKTALFHFNQSLTIGTPTNCYCDIYSDYSDYSDSHVHEIPSHPKTMNWSMSSDHCTWEGVTCEHKTGDVIGLDLTCSQLEGAILPNSTLFQLSHLRFLNLSYNDFSLSNQFPQEFGFFAKGLTHLNLSFTQFSGRVPSGISHLYKLVSLDLSENYCAILEDEVFKSLLQNLTQLRVLNLESVNISSVLPMNLSTSYRVLYLEETGLQGVLPQEVFHLPNLEVLDLSNNYDLTATLPKVKWGSSATLQHLRLGGININGGIPSSIGFLDSLTTLALLRCSMSGPVPGSIGSLSQLTQLYLQSNNLNGPIPTLLSNLTNLRTLFLDHNNFTGPLPPGLFDLPSLSELDLSDNGFTGQLYEFHSSKSLKYFDCQRNSLTGPLPPWLFDHTSLVSLFLNNNRFTGQLPEFYSSKSKLDTFDCRSNLLHGNIPQSFSQLVNLAYLDFSSNNFSGVLDFEMFSRLEYLNTLDLSHNSLSLSNISTIPPNMNSLRMTSCKIKEFPHYSGKSQSLNYLDLSNNQIHGEIPKWIGLIGGGGAYLNLAHNNLTGGLGHIPWNVIKYLDIQSNQLNGSLPTLICNSTSLEILNLSHNNLSGILPGCPTNLTYPSVLSVLDLRMNNIHGSLPSTLSNFRYLKSLNLHGNKLKGRIPSYFAELDLLETLDLGSNQIKDTFPQCLEALPNLQVLVLKSNKFHGPMNKSSLVEQPFPSLRIIDLSYNDFSGPLPTIYFRNFKAMMNGEVNKIERSYMGQSYSRQSYYSDSTVLVIKGVEIVLERILTVFTTIDVSRNNFEGVIVDNIGNLVSLRLLNLSHNNLTGHISSSIGKLLMLESLDLSFNHLEGEIPQQLTDIYTLECLNLSCNQLSGHIPKGSQFDTYGNDSYVGNFGLCGPPLSKKCENNSSVQEKEKDEDGYYFFGGFTWEAVVIGYACGVVPAFLIGYLMLLAGKPKWFAGIIARELGTKKRRMEIKWR